MWHRFASIKYYINVYITVVPKIISHCSFGALFSHRSSFRFLSTALEYFDLNCEDKVLGSKSLHDLFGTANELNEEIRIHGCYHKTKSSDTRKLEELMSVGYLVQAIRARRIFEIGTFVGRMTRILAINAEQAEVLTIDLPQNSVPHNVGEDYVNTKERARITQLYGDSSHFDFSAWKDQIDFCWVDACHDYEFVMADTRAAFMMVRDGGWIAWHDYRHTAWWSGVTKAVWRCHREISNEVVHLLGTTIALVKVDARMKEAATRL